VATRFSSGRSWISSAAFDESILHNINESLASLKHVMVQASGVRRDGTLFPAEIFVNRVALANEAQLCFSIRDVTARHETVSKLEDAQRNC